MKKLCDCERSAGLFAGVVKLLHWPFLYMVFFGGGAVALLAARLLTLALLPEELPAWYAIGAWCADLLWIALFLSGALFFRSRLLAGAAAALIVLELIFHALNLSLLHSTISVVSYSMCMTLMENTDSISLGVYLGSFYWLYIALAIGALLLLIAAAAESFSVLFKGNDSIRKSKTVIYPLCAFFVIAGSAYLAFYRNAKNDILYKGWFPREWGARPIQQYAWDIVSEASDRRKHRIEENVPGYFEANFPDAATLDQWRRLGLAGNKPLPVKRLVPYKKILIIAVESLDYDFIYGKDSPADIAPFLKQLGEGKFPGLRSFVMTNYHTSAQPTAEALNSILASRLDYPRDKMLRNPSLYTVLSQHGYAGYYFNGVSGDFRSQREEISGLFKAGHNFFLEDLYNDRKLKGDGYWGIDDVSLLNAAFDKLLNEKSDRVFCVISTIDTHAPYRTSTHLERNFGTPFLNSIAALDRNLERFLSRVTASSWFDDDTLIIITADHSATHGANPTQRTEFTPDRIPLYFIDRAGRLESRIKPSRMCGAIDFAPTILHMLGMEAPESFMGRSFLDPLGRAISIYDLDTVFIRRDAAETLRIKISAPRNGQEKAVASWFRLYYGD